jgi:hypothetical protein
MAGKKHQYGNQQDTMFRQAAAYLASLGGYDDHERPLCPIGASILMVRGMAKILGLTEEEITIKLDSARRQSWHERELAGDLDRGKGACSVARSSGPNSRAMWVPQCAAGDQP